MTPRQITLVKRSWQRVLCVAELAPELFYRKLFAFDPDLERLFHGDMAAQGRKLMAMLDLVVSRLDRLDEVLPGVVALGRRHVAYGVEDAHYDTVGAALLCTLRAALGDELDGETEAAWAVAYGTLANVMKAAAAEARRAPERVGADPARPSSRSSPASARARRRTGLASLPDRMHRRPQ